MKILKIIKKVLCIALASSFFAFIGSGVVSAGGGTCVADWCHRMYDYQKKEKIADPYENTGYEWCVHKWGSSPLDVYSWGPLDYDRLKSQGGAQGGKCDCTYDGVLPDFAEAHKC